MKSEIKQINNLIEIVGGTTNLYKLYWMYYFYYNCVTTYNATTLIKRFDKIKHKPFNTHINGCNNIIQTLEKNALYSYNQDIITTLTKLINKDPQLKTNKD